MEVIFEVGFIGHHFFTAVVLSKNEVEIRFFVLFVAWWDMENGQVLRDSFTPPLFFQPA